MPRTKRKRGADSTSRRRRNAETNEAAAEPAQQQQQQQLQEEQEENEAAEDTTITTNATVEDATASTAANNTTVTTAAAAAAADPPATATTKKKLKTKGSNKNNDDNNNNNDDGDDDGDGDSSTSRAQRIRDALEHRRLLLQRVRQAKAAAQQQIDRHPNKDMTPQQELAAFAEMCKAARSTKGDGSGATGSATSNKAAAAAAAAASGRSSVSLRRGASVGRKMNAVLSSLSGTASAAAAAAAAASATAQATTSSLPATAATSITTGVGVPIAAAAAAPSTKIKQQQQQLQQLQPLQSSTATIIPQLPAAAPASLSSTNPNATTNLLSNNNATAAAATASMGAPSRQPKQKQSRPPSTSTINQQQKLHQQQPAAAAAGRAGPYTAALQQQQRTNAAAAVGGGISVHGTTRQPQQHQQRLGSRYLTQTAPPPPPPPPRVVCPQTTALRERRNDLRTQLAKLVQDRQSRLEHAAAAAGDSSSPLSQQHRRGSIMAERRASTMSVATTTATPSISRYPSSPGTTPRQLHHQHHHPSSSSRSATPSASSSMTTGTAATHSRPMWRGPDPPPALPARRRTHWDTLLDEMQWMATDFTQERRWKQAAAKLVATTAAVSAALQRQQQSKTADAAAAATAVVDVETASEENTDGSATGAAAAVAGKNTGDDVSKTIDSRDDTAVVVDGGGGDAVVIDEDDPLAEEAAARRVAQTLSQRIAELALQSSSSQLEEGVFEKEDDDEAEHGGRVDPSRITENGEEANNSAAAVDDMDVVPVDKKTALERTSRFVQDILDRLQQQRGESEDGTSSTAATAKVSSKQANKKATLSSEATKENEPLPLLASQRTVVRTVEQRWHWQQQSSTAVGSVLRGTVASGKTIVAATLLWRHRGSGPQLLVCSSARMIRWMHELGRFPDLNLKVLDENGARKSSPESSYSASDVVLCQHGTIAQLNHEKGRILLRKFRSVVIDCRHPTGFAGSTRATATGTVEFNNEARDRAAPVELSSSSWWAQVVEVTAGDDDVQRLLIDNNPVVVDDDSSLQYLRGLSKREFLGVLALRVGFLLGIKVFASPVYNATEKAILAWARYKIKGDNSETRSKFRRVSQFLSTLSMPMCCYMEPSIKIEEIDLSESDFVSWEVLPCEMGSSQRLAYETVCNDVRSALSRSLDVRGYPGDTDPFAEAALALLRVRRQCFHSDVEGAISMVKMRDSHAISSMKSLLGANSSQPNAELAKRILEGSCKLRHLASVLVRDCGHKNIGGENSFDSLLKQDTAGESFKKKPATAPMKIAILAMLPEIHILVSLLLNAMGIDHEILFRPSSSLPDAATDSKVAAAAWAHSQLVLSRFNGDESHWRSDVNVVIASPLSIAGDFGGLGVENADAIFCLDEDWSGRGELLFWSLAARCSRHREASGKDSCRVVRLVAKNTCEETLLGTDSGSKEAATEKNGNSKEWPWPLDEVGLFVAPAAPAGKEKNESLLQFWESRSPNHDKFSFPGCNLFARRDQTLDGLLCSTKPRPRLFSSSSELKFLPVLQDEDAVETEMMLLKTLLKEESVSSIWGSGSTAPLESLSDNMVPALPPFASEFPPKFVESADISCTASRLFFERILDDGGVGTANVTALPQLGDESGASGAIAANGTSALLEPVFTVAERDPVETASSILFYKSNKKRDHSSMDGEYSAETDQTSPASNFYAAAFSNSEHSFDFHDGNQGSEALVYFPPIFPRMQECAVLAKADVESLWARGHTTTNDTSGSDQDGKPHAAEPTTKRPRLDPARVITEDEASHSDAASVLMDLSDDYGLAGMGAVPLPRDSALTAAHYTVNATGNASVGASQAQNAWLAADPLCDPEEYQAATQTNPADAGSESMILLVSRKRPRGYTGMAGSSLLGRGLSSGTSAWNGVAQAVFQDLNGTRGTKHSAFNRIPMPGSAQARSAASQLQRTKDVYRYRLLANLRQSGIGSTIFEAPIFRVAAVRVRNKVSDRLLRHGWTSTTAFEAGPGLPLLISKPHTPSSPQYRGMFDVDPNLWTSIVKRLKNKNSATGGEAIELSFAQRSALRRSLAAPCRVDFGPFHCGFLSSPSGMTVVAPPRPRVGVSLPMGVKITHSEKDQSLQQWSATDDQKLQSSAVRFGMNWIVAARALSGYQDLIIFSQSESNNFLPQRAARSCRDRWQRLARSDPSMVMKVRQSDRFTSSADTVPEGGDPGRRVMLLLEDSQESNNGDDEKKEPVTDLNKFELLLPPPECDKEKHPGTTERESTTLAQPAPVARPKRRTFGALKLAKEKRKSAPTVLASPPGVAQSHPSHVQSVQEAVAASRSNGGSIDMWPIQLLETADRQRAAAAAAAMPPPEAPTVRRESSSSSRITVPTSNRTSLGSAGQNVRRTSSGVPHQQIGVAAHMPMPARANMASPIRPKNNATGAAAVSASGSAKQSFVPPPASVVAKQSFAPPPQPPKEKVAAAAPAPAEVSARTPAPARSVAATTSPSKNPDDRGRQNQPKQSE